MYLYKVFDHPFLGPVQAIDENTPRISYEGSEALHPFVLPLTWSNPRGCAKIPPERKNQPCMHAARASGQDLFSKPTPTCQTIVEALSRQ